VSVSREAPVLGVVTVTTGVTRRVRKSTTEYIPRVFVRQTRTELWKSSAFDSSADSLMSSMSSRSPSAPTSEAAGAITATAPVARSTRTMSEPPPSAGRTSRYDVPFLSQ
jgi:hypothetical protein